METVKREGIDIVLRWMYQSMLEDVVLSRLEKKSKQIEQIINQSRE
jgi:hypothetical protein